MFGLFGSSKQKWETTDVSTPTKPHEYEDVRKNVLNTVLEWTNSDDGWTPFSIVDNVTLESKVVDNSGITATRGTLTFEGSDFNRFVDNLFESSDESKKKIFEDMEANTVVKNLDHNNMVVHSQFRAPPTIYWREFVVLKSRTVLSDGRHVITAISINDETVPHSKGYVRGVVISGMIVTPPKKDDNMIKIVKVEHVNPKGWLPVSLINMMKGKVGKTLARMTVYL